MPIPIPFENPFFLLIPASIIISKQSVDIQVPKNFWTLFYREICIFVALIRWPLKWKGAVPVGPVKAKPQSFFFESLREKYGRKWGKKVCVWKNTLIWVWFYFIWFVSDAIPCLWFKKIFEKLFTFLTSFFGGILVDSNAIWENGSTFW